MAKARKGYRTPVNVQRFGFWLPPDVVERARNTVDALSGPPERLTLSGLVVQALEEKIGRLERKYHEGLRFPKRPGELRRGSRPKI